MKYVRYYIGLSSPNTWFPAYGTERQALDATYDNLPYVFKTRYNPKKNYTTYYRVDRPEKVFTIKGEFCAL
jgi:hypothetical protein